MGINNMAKDDYDVIVYRLLVYLYGCLKRKITFDDAVFRETVRKNVDNDEYCYTMGVKMPYSIT